MNPLHHLMLTQTVSITTRIVDEEIEAQAGYVTCPRSHSE